MPDNSGGQSRPPSPEQAPDPTTSYERAKPEKEAGMGRLDNNAATPADDPDRQEQTVKNRQPPRQRNAQDEVDERASVLLGGPQERTPPPMPPPEPVDHSMMEEEPDGWDLAPQERKRDRDRRHPRTGGKGGTPDATDRRRSQG